MSELSESITQLPAGDELSESITQLPAGDDLAALLLKRWTSGADDDAPENISDDGSWVDVAPDDENNDWCYLRADEVDGASDADDASHPLGDGANAVGANAVGANAVTPPPPPQCRSDGRVDAATLEAKLAAATARVAALETQNAQLRRSASDKVDRDEVSLEDLERDLRAAAARCLSGDVAAERDVERLSRALDAHPEKIRRDAAQREAWERDERPRCASALRRMRRVLPPWLATRGASVDTLEAAGLPRAVARRLFRERALWLTRMPASRIRKMALADLRRLDLGRLDVVELRAVYASLPAAFDADSQGEKAAWREAARERLVALAAREAADKLLRREVRHPVYDALDAVGGPFDPDAKADAAVAAPSTTNLESELAAVRRARRRSDAVVAPAPAPVRPRPARLDADDPRPAMVRQAIARRPPPPRRSAMAGDLLAGLQAAARRRA